jgi:hypothetical protein
MKDLIELQQTVSQFTGEPVKKIDARLAYHENRVIGNGANTVGWKFIFIYKTEIWMNKDICISDITEGEATAIGDALIYLGEIYQTETLKQN